MKPTDLLCDVLVDVAVKMPRRVVKDRSISICELHFISTVRENG